MGLMKKRKVKQNLQKMTAFYAHMYYVLFVFYFRSEQSL